MKADPRFLLPTLAFIAIISGGCNVSTGISTHTPVLEHSSGRDFGFVGSWILVQSSETLSSTSHQDQLVIAKNEAETGYVAELSLSPTDEFTFVVRTCEIRPDLPYAIVEIELRGREVLYRRLGIAAVRDESLCIWTIDGRKVGELLYAAGIPAVIEHESYSSTVRCSTPQLVEFVSQNFRQILGGVLVFRRVAEAAK